MGKATKGVTLQSKLKWLGRRNKLVKENAASSNEPINFRENDYGDFRSQACFTFSLVNNSDILMLTEKSLSSPISLPYL